MNSDGLANGDARERRVVRLADVAARAGVDRSVVSRLVNNDPGLHVRDSTRERVMAAIAELGYRPNAAARSLRTARAGAFGLIIPDFANPVYASVITGAAQAAAQSDIVLLTASTDGDANAMRRHLELLSSGRVDGMLLAGEVDEDLLAFLDQLDLPWLLVNRTSPRARRSIILNDEGAAAMAVQHLVELGHRRLAHLAGPAKSDTAARRRAGYVTAVSAAGLPSRVDVVAEADYTAAGGARAMAQLLEGRDRPTAVVVANVASAIGALHTINAAGLGVPRDVSVVAVHDLPLAGWLIPPLTTVAMPLEQMGGRAIHLLRTLPPGQHVREVVDGPMELIRRGSTAALVSAPSRPGRRSPRRGA